MCLRPHCSPESTQNSVIFVLFRLFHHRGLQLAILTARCCADTARIGIHCPWYLCSCFFKCLAKSLCLSHSWTTPSRTFPPRPSARFELYMAWLWILFICQLRPLDAFPAFLRERGLRRNVWEMIIDLFPCSAPEKCTIPDFSLFPHFAAMLSSTADTHSASVAHC